jgi:creatinine amidohydrolase
VEEMAARDPVVVLPLGAVEQHGPHLPLSTDGDIAVGLLEAALDHLPSDAPVWTLPLQPVGASREHARHPGTLSLEPAVLSGLLVQIGQGLARSRVRRLVLHTGHGGNRHVMDDAALRLRDHEGMLVVKVHYPRLGRPPGVDLPEAEWRDGLHGGAVETALMLHLRPESVRMEAAPEGFTPPVGGAGDRGRLLSPQGPASWGWLGGDLGPEGVAGRPELATPELGAVLADHYGRTLARVLREAADFPVEELG